MESPLESLACLSNVLDLLASVAVNQVNHVGAFAVDCCADLELMAGVDALEGLGFLQMHFADDTALALTFEAAWLSVSSSTGLWWSRWFRRHENVAQVSAVPLSHDGRLRQGFPHALALV